MAKIIFIIKELLYLIARHKLYILAPILILLALLSLLVYYIGPAAIVSFIYAGV